MNRKAMKRLGKQRVVFTYHWQKNHTVTRDDPNKSRHGLVGFSNGLDMNIIC